MPSFDSGLAEVLAQVARALESADSVQGTLQKMVDLAPATVPGCDHAGVSLVVDKRFVTPAASDEVPEAVDRIQYETGQGPCLSAILEESVFCTDDLGEDDRWPDFSARAAAETGVRSMLSFRLFLREDTMGSLNLYSRAPRAFTEASKSLGSVFASHAAVAFAAALEHDRAQELRQDLHSSERRTRRYHQQAEIAGALQRGMLCDLPDAGPLRLAARYVASVSVADVGGDWYDAFILPDGATALVIGDIEGHDLDATIWMGQIRNLLRALAIDRRDAPGELLHRLDDTLEHLGFDKTATCIYARVDDAADGSRRVQFANAGHLPPLLISPHGDARYLHGSPDPLLGAAPELSRQTFTFTLPPDTTLLLYTDGLIEARDRDIDDSLARLRQAASHHGAEPPEQLCQRLLSELAAHPTDDVCMIAVRTPPGAGDPNRKPSDQAPPHSAGQNSAAPR